MKKIILATFVLSCPVSLSFAAPLHFEPLPLFMDSLTPPNAFILLDDSGSMDWEIMTSPYWDPCSYDAHFSTQYHATPTCGTLINNQGLMRSFANNAYRNFSYIYANNDNLYGQNNSCDLDEYNALENCQIKAISDWRMLSSSLNTLYYNPAFDYKPWPGSCYNESSTPCKEAIFTSALSNPKEGSPGFTITKDLSQKTLASYHIWIDNKGFNKTDGRPLRADKINMSPTANNLVDLWDSHLQFIFTPLNTIEIYRHDYQPDKKSINPVVKKIATLSDPQNCYTILGADITDPVSTNGKGCRTISQAQQNFANWYQYHRKRSFIAKNAVATLVAMHPNVRFGLTTLNQSDNFFIEIPSANLIDYSKHNQSLLTQLFDLSLMANASPLRIGLDRVGKYYAGELPKKNSPLTNACQKNIALLLTDGYWNDSDLDINPNITDIDKDGIPRTLADVARYYYLKDLSPLANHVATNIFDSASWQHLSTFGIHFGHTGKLRDTDGDGWPNPPLQENSDWGNPNFSGAEKVDDLWHAAYNSKGAYVSIFDSKALSKQFTSFLPVRADHLSGVASPALNSTVLNEQTYAYFSQFNSPNWTGALFSYHVTPLGINTQPIWQANIKNHAERVILTKGWRKTDKGIAFRWPDNLTELNNENQLTDIATPFLNNNSKALLDYLRGDNALEQVNKGPFRNRPSLLGDIIYSQPVYVGSPIRSYPDNMAEQPYTQFKKQQASRTPMIYVGANDGMLHGFHAQTGEEKLAFIPGMSDIFSNLPKLASPTYSHEYFVDGPLTEADVTIHNQWQTLLVGTARQGGKGIFALNITDPNHFSEKNANSIYLWEFTDKNDAGVGYVFNQAYVTQLKYPGKNNRQWAVIFGNGYQTSETALYILFIEPGPEGSWTIDKNYLKISVPKTPNQKIAGISSIYPVDKDGDFVTDYVYATDLNGQIWKFDLTDSTPANWKTKTTLFFTASFSEPGDQPISAPLVVTPHPLGIEKGVMIYFGTGKYLESVDTQTTGVGTQSFYGLWDQFNDQLPTKNALLKQTILSEIAKNQKVIRHVSHSDINWTGQYLGWYLDFFVSGRSSNQGEKMVTKPIVHDGKILFTTLIPNLNACEFGGQSWLMSLNAENGGSLKELSFDLNSDKKFDEEDKITIDNQGNKAIPAGLLSPVGISSSPAVLSSPDRTQTMILLNGITGMKSVLEKTGSLRVNRQQEKKIN
jgi:type IV pilus assembly protein PilY1